MKGKGLVKGLGITLKHFFEREITEQYPEVMPELPERYRGSLQFDFDKCIACGICANNCPNDVLTIETVTDEKTKKKKLLSYTIDFQYCMFCNMCVEGCPAKCLSFDKNFELSKFSRDEIKTVYRRPEGLDEEAENAEEVEAAQPEEDDKEQKQIDALKKALAKNPQKLLAKVLESEEDVNILAALVQRDEKIAGKMAELIIMDKEKAAKVAAGFVNKEKKNIAAQTEQGKEENDV